MPQLRHHGTVKALSRWLETVDGPPKGRDINICVSWTREPTGASAERGKAREERWAAQRKARKADIGPAIRRYAAGGTIAEAIAGTSLNTNRFRTMRICLIIDYIERISPPEPHGERRLSPRGSWENWKDAMRDEQFLRDKQAQWREMYLRPVLDRSSREQCKLLSLHWDEEEAA